MNREEAKALLPILQAYAGGKPIQQKDYNLTDGSWKWTDVKDDEEIDLCGTYRIKPTPTYRPFANAEECWEEMKKHEPFGWLTLKEFVDNHTFLDEINDSLSFDMYFKEYTFADGQPFGKLTEEG